MADSYSINLSRKTLNDFFNKEVSSSTENSSEIAEIISLMAKVDLKSPQAKANIMSITDNNGKRIIL